MTTARNYESMRKGLLGKVHVAKAQLGLTDQHYRDLLEAKFNVRSASELNCSALEALLRHFEKIGWASRPAQPRKGRARDKHGAPRNLREAGLDSRANVLTKIEAVLTEQGKDQGAYLPWDYAAAILKRMYKVDRLEWATLEQLRGVLAALMRGGRRKYPPQLVERDGQQYVAVRRGKGWSYTPLEEYLG